MFSTFSGAALLKFFGIFFEETLEMLEKKIFSDLEVVSTLPFASCSAWPLAAHSSCHFSPRLSSESLAQPQDVLGHHVLVKHEDDQNVLSRKLLTCDLRWKAPDCHLTGA